MLRRLPSVPAGRVCHALAIVFVATAAGCQSDASVELESMRAGYNAGEYEATQERADDLATSSSGRTRDEAMYLSGLSAYRLGDLDDAERRLLVAAESSDAETAANAKASLGLIRLDQQRPREAAVLFQEASAGLATEDLDRATRYADAAQRQAGTTTEGWKGHAAPGAYAGEPEAFSLQIGAFRERRRAERAASDASRNAASRRLGPARVIPRDRDAERLYFVQIGRFQSRSEAARERERIGRREYIVAASLEKF